MRISASADSAVAGAGTAAAAVEVPEAEAEAEAEAGASGGSESITSGGRGGVAATAVPRPVVGGGADEAGGDRRRISPA
jgi:hypothetical protein